MEGAWRFVVRARWMARRVSVGLAVSALTVAVPAAVGRCAEWPRIISIGTNPTGTLYATYALGLANLLTRYLGAEVRSVPTNGPVVWMPMFERDEMELGSPTYSRLRPHTGGSTTLKPFPVGGASR